MRGQDGVLIATLGTKPQVVTTAIDLLLDAGHRLSEVQVLFPPGSGEQSPLAPALRRLAAEFAEHAAYRSLRLRLEPLAGEAGALADTESEAAAAAAFRAIYQALLRAKREEPARPVHLSITGGRKVLAVYGMAAAQLLFDDDDHVWYVLAGGQFLAEARLHPGPGDEARLVPVPVLRWSTVSPVLTDLREIDDPFQAAERQEAVRLRQVLEEARSFVLGALSGAERRVVELLVREGLSDSAIADRLSLSPRTVERHLGDAYRKAAAHWELTSVTRTQLVVLLSLYFATQPSREA